MPEEDTLLAANNNAVDKGTTVWFLQKTTGIKYEVTIGDFVFARLLAEPHEYEIIRTPENNEQTKGQFDSQVDRDNQASEATANGSSTSATTGHELREGLQPEAGKLLEEEVVSTSDGLDDLITEVIDNGSAINNDGNTGTSTVSNKRSGRAKSSI